MHEFKEHGAPVMGLVEEAGSSPRAARHLRICVEVADALDIHNE